MRFSAPVKKHWLGSFSIVLPFSGLRGFVPVMRDRWEQGEGGAGGGGGPGPESIYLYYVPQNPVLTIKDTNLKVSRMETLTFGKP